jgi:hypothetical protein
MMSATIVRPALSGFVWPTDEGQMTSDKIWRHVTYSALHKYGITARRSIRRRVFSRWFSGWQTVKNDKMINSQILEFMSFYLFLFVWIFFRCFCSLVRPLKVVPKVSDHSDTALVILWQNLFFTLLFIHFIFKKEFLFSHRIYITLS